MRTTIDIETDVLAAAKEIARQKGVGVGKVVSHMMRQALTSGAQTTTAAGPLALVTGFEPFAARGVVVSNELINQLRDVEGV